MARIVHTVGRCDGPGFDSAGAALEPDRPAARQPQPARAAISATCPISTSAPTARGRLEFTIRGATLRGGARPLLDADGAAVVIHAAPDDYRTDPSGNSGARIACGVLAS